MSAKDGKNMKARFEKGFTRIPNTMFDALICSNLNNTQKDMCYYLIRKSFGWRKGYAAISLNEFAFVCRTTKPYIFRQRKALLKKKVLIILGRMNDQKTVYLMNPDIAQWDKSCIDLDFYGDFINTGRTKRLSSEITLELSSETTQELYPEITLGLSSEITLDALSDLEGPDSQAPLKKDLKKKKESSLYCEDSPPYKLSVLLLDYILEHLPGFKRPDLQKWSLTIDRMIRLDNRDPEEIKKVITYAQEDEFWRSNILSADKLRKQYDTLNAKRMFNIKHNRSYDYQNYEGGEEDEYSFFFEK